jgi:AhpD family alkylhydroperoxidase
MMNFKRANYFNLANDAIQILMQQESYLAEAFSNSPVLTSNIWELIKLRISQMNQCAFCVEMHTSQALETGESIDRIMGVSAWHGMPYYSPIERYALEYCEILSQGNDLSDKDYERFVEAFGEKAMVDLTIAINAINSWNRIAKTFKPEVGSYKPS